MVIRRILTAEEPILREKTKKVTHFDASLHRLLDDLLDTMRDAPGVGLAANQVGVLRRMFVFVDGEEDRVLVNPVVTRSSSSLETDVEGCLSLRDVHVPVERPTAVTIEGQSLEGEPVVFELEAPASRVVQHELDHLDGVLIIDRTDGESRRVALATLRPQPILGAR